MASSCMLDNLCLAERTYSEFLLNRLKKGFKIVDLPDILPESECANYKSATCAPNLKISVKSNLHRTLLCVPVKTKDV